MKNLKYTKFALSFKGKNTKKSKQAPRCSWGIPELPWPPPALEHWDEAAWKSWNSIPCQVPWICWREFVILLTHCWFSSSPGEIGFFQEKILLWLPGVLWVMAVMGLMD